MIHSIIRIILVVSFLGCLSSCIYYLLCLWSAAAFLRRHNSASNGVPARSWPPISILKPLKGIDPDLYESFRSHCLQDYPEFEIIFGVSDPLDPAVAFVERLKREFPARAIRLVVCPEILGANVKVSNLQQTVQMARHQLLIVDDSDIRVESDYLQRIVAPLADERIGMVTCLYRGIAAATLGSRLEAIGISTDFCAGVLAARQLEGRLHFGLGSTLAFWRGDLERIGGFHAFVDFLADDYELGRRISGLGKKVELSEVVVETHLPAYDLRAFLAHQLRWFRGVRDARLGGYIGLVSTFGLTWALINLISSGAASWSWEILATTLFLRLAVALVVGGAVLHDRHVMKRLWLLPLRDLIATAVWIMSFAGHTVTWRGDRFELRNGRLTRLVRHQRGS